MILGIPQDSLDRFLLRNREVQFIFRFLVHPIIAGLLFTLVFSFWHIGAFYEAAIRDKTLHMAEHLSMLFTSVLMWWPLCSKSKVCPPLLWSANALCISIDAWTNSDICNTHFFEGSAL